MKEKILVYFSGIFSLFLIPYFVTTIVNGVDIALVNRPPDVENCLPVLLSFQIPEDYELEAVKSQAVVARSNFYRSIKEKRGREYLREMEGDRKELYSLWKLPAGVYEKAVEQTRGKVLTVEGELKLTPYHAISAGATRDGEEVMHDAGYGYLASVDSSHDKQAKEYISSSYVSENQMPESLEIKERDGAGYVMSLKTEENYLEGEAFRQGMNLSSSNFSIQRVGREYRFLCKGKGHGLGLSQYGGNELAKAGDTYQEILKTYFPGMELTDGNRIFEKK